MILYVSFYELVDDGIGVGSVVVVLDQIQTVTIPLPIHHCIHSTTYGITNYNINNKQRKLQNIRNFLK